MKVNEARRAGGRGDGRRCGWAGEWEIVFLGTMARTVAFTQSGTYITSWIGA